MNNNNKTRGISGLMLLLCAVFMIGAYWFMNQAEKQEKAYTYREFQEDLQDNHIK